MCLHVIKKYEFNEEERVAYKVFREVIEDGKKRYVTIFQGAALDEDWEMYVLNPPTFVAEELHGGAIHCFTNLEDASDFARDLLSGYSVIVIFKVIGIGVIAEGIFNTTNKQYDSIAFGKIRATDRIGVEIPFPF